jgi:hypothetical protein
MANKSKDSRSASWKTRVATAKAAHVVVTDADFAGIRKGSRLLIASPEILARYLMKIPSGETRGIVRLRNELARRHNADATCPVTTAIYLRVIAEAAWEALCSGVDRNDVPPFWRVIDPGTPIARRLTFGADVIERERAYERDESTNAGVRGSQR